MAVMVRCPQTYSHIVSTEETVIDLIYTAIHLFFKGSDNYIFLNLRSRGAGGGSSSRLWVTVQTTAKLTLLGP